MNEVTAKIMLDSLDDGDYYILKLSNEVESRSILLGVARDGNEPAMKVTELAKVLNSFNELMTADYDYLEDELFDDPNTEEEWYEMLG